jgi:hypothetical protein
MHPLGEVLEVSWLIVATFSFIYGSDPTISGSGRLQTVLESERHCFPSREQLLRDQRDIGFVRNTLVRAIVRSRFELLLGALLFIDKCSVLPDHIVFCH